MRTNNKKASSSTWRVDKFGHVPVTANGVKSIFRFSRAQQNPAVNSNALVGFPCNEQVEALALEAEAKRNQGRVYAGVTPIR